MKPIRGVFSRHWTAGVALVSIVIESLPIQVRTARNDEEAAISTIAGERAYLACQLTLHFLEDSIQLQMDSVRYWTQQVTTLPHQYVLAAQCLQEGDTLQAETILDSILLNFSLSANQQKAHSDFEQLVALKKGLVENGDWINFAQENESALKDLAEQGISKASIQAQFYYNFVFGETYFPVIDWIDAGSNSAGKISLPPSEESPKDVPPDIVLKVVPNPAREFVQFQFSMPPVDNPALLRLFDSSGRMIKSWELELETGTIEWQIDSRVQKGIYMISLTVDGKNPVTQRFSIVE